MSRKSVGDNKNNTKDAPNNPNESLNDENKWEDNKKLCDLVQQYPLLYDRAHSDYGRKEATDAAWKAIAALCGDAVDKCKNRWQNIRSNYKQSLEKESKLGKAYYLAEYLEFVRPHLNNVRRHSEVGVANKVKTETTDDKNDVGDNKDLPQLSEHMQNMKLNRKSQAPKKNIQKPKTTKGEKPDEVVINININKR